MASKNERRYPPLNPTLYRIVRFVLAVLVKTLTRHHVEGQEKVPEDGPVIVMSNHLHHLDAAVIGAAVPRFLHALAAKKYEKHVFSLLLRVAGAIFIHRGEADRQALRQALNALEDGHLLLVFVEGTRSDTGGLAKGKTGVAYLASRTGATIVPMVTWGTENVIDAWMRLRRADTYVKYGDPIHLPEGRARSEKLEEFTDDFMMTLAHMLPRQYRGIYTDRVDEIERTGIQPTTTSGS